MKITRVLESGIVEQSSDDTTIHVPNIGRITPDQLRLKIADLSNVIHKMASSSDVNVRSLVSKVQMLQSLIFTLEKHHKDMH